MRESSLEPTPRGRLEQIYDSSLGFILPPNLVFVVAFDPLSRELGYWPALAIVVAAGIALAMIISLPAIPLKRRRVALDAERGLVECAHRERGSSLKARWATGYAKAEPGRLLFQAKTGLTGPLIGAVEIYLEPKPLGQPVRAPFSVFPRGKIMAFDTAQGVVELAAAPSSLILLAERGFRDGS